MESEAIHGVLTQARVMELEQQELLHPRPQRVPDPFPDGVNIHDAKTPRVAFGG